MSGDPENEPSHFPSYRAAVHGTQVRVTKAKAPKSGSINFSLNLFICPP